MALNITSALAVSACNTLVDAIDAGSGTAQLIIYGGTVPTNVEEALSDQAALVTFDLPNPAFSDAVQEEAGGVATANAVPTVQAAADGTATFFRILNGNSVPVMQGIASNVGDGGELELSSTNILEGIDVIVVSLSATMPKG